MNDDRCERVFIVLVNEEEQYSLWPKDKIVPEGWYSIGKEGSEDECRCHVDQVWMDMRPLSVRQRVPSLDANEL